MIGICSICHRHICPASCPNTKYVDVSCPVCGSDSYEYVYGSRTGDIIGCGDCVSRIDAEEYFLKRKDSDLTSEEYDEEEII